MRVLEWARMQSTGHEFLSICPLVTCAWPGELSLAGFSGKVMDQIPPFSAPQWPATVHRIPRHFGVRIWQRKQSCRRINSFCCGQQPHPASRGQQGPQNNSRDQCLVPTADVSGQRRATWGSVTGQFISLEASSEV